MLPSITVDNPPVNALSAGVPEAISDAVERACHDSTADAIVLIGAGTTFIAGADINIFKQLKTREQSIERSQAVHTRLKKLEDAGKPLVAAIHGHALGGGLEFAMACHYRVAVATAKVGQPEVHLGIIPGAGGTQRLPRLCGPALALEMCTEGKPVAAARAVQAGIVDAVIDGDLLEGAIAFARARAAATERRRTRDLQDRIGDRAAGIAACQAMRATLGKTARGARAPFAAVDAIEACLTMDFDAGSRREIELFADCVLSVESKAMRHLFFAEREAGKIPDVPKDTPTRAIARAAIVGAGTMGGGIAMAYANAGIPVLLKDVDQAALDRGMSVIRKNYESTMAKGRMTPEAMARTLALITPTTSYDGFGDVDIVVEAVFENMDLKKSTFAELAAVTRPDAILASNTSTLDIDELAAASGRETQVVGHHFFSPANVMKLLEIVRGRATSTGGDRDVVEAREAAEQGWRGRRQLFRVRRQPHARVLHARGVPPARGRRQRLADRQRAHRLRLSGGTVRDAGHRRHRRRLAHPPAPEVGREDAGRGTAVRRSRSPLRHWAATARRRARDGTGTSLAAERAFPIRSSTNLPRKRRQQRGVTRRVVSDEEIIARIMTALANEGARVLEEGYATRASDIDVVYVHGFGFPRHRGGPMFYADTVGLPTVLARVKEYREQFGDYWRPSPLLEKLAIEGRGFHGDAA